VYIISENPPASRGGVTVHLVSQGSLRQFHRELSNHVLNFSIDTPPEILRSNMIVHSVISMVDETIPIPEWSMLNRIKSDYPLV
jgi:hypothetical protein